MLLRCSKGFFDNSRKIFKVRDDIMEGIEAVVGVRKSQWVNLNLNLNFKIILFKS